MPEESKSWPFSSYDFFGYLMPGLIFFMTLCAWLIYADYISLPEDFIKEFKSVAIGNSIIILFIVFSISYFLGHLIGAVSHLLYDRILIRNIIGYPFQRLLKTSHEPDDETRSSYIKILMVLLALLIIPGFVELCVYLYDTILFSWEKVLMIDNLIPLFFESLFGVLAFIYLFCLFIGRIRKMNNDEVGKKDDKKTGHSENIIAAIVKRFVLKPIRKLTATNTFLENEIVAEFESLMKKQHHLNVNTNSSDVFWLASIDLQKDKCVDRRLMNWLNLYGCLRNYSCAFFMLAVIIASSHWYRILWLHKVTDLQGSRILLASLVISGILFLRYWIIYYSYYSKYIIRAYVCSMQNQDEEKGNEGL